MDILGIGIPELAFIILIALVVLGPKDMQKAGKTIAGNMRKIITSPEWRTVKDVSTQVRTLPQEWMREANQEIQGIGDSLNIDNDLLTPSGRPKFVVPKKEDAVEVLAEGENG